MLSLNELTCGAGKCLGHTNTIGLCHPPLVCLPLTFSSSPKWNSIQHEQQVHECNQITFGWSERNFPLQLAFPAFYELTKTALIAWRLKMFKNDSKLPQPKRRSGKRAYGGMDTSCEQPFDSTLEATDCEEDRRSSGWTQSPKTCVQWMSPQRTPKTDSKCRKQSHAGRC